MVEEELKLAGDFLPSKTQKSLSTVNKGMLPEILTEIEYYFKKYLKEQYGYFIGVSKRDHIEILFEPKHAEDSKLQFVMSSLSEHEMLCRFGLRKNHTKWGTVNFTTNYLEFVLLPPWVKETEELTKTAPQTLRTKGRDTQ
jgi:hypothetical protein